MQRKEDDSKESFFFLYTVIVGLISILCFCVYKIYPDFRDSQVSKKVDEKVQEIIDSTVPESEGTVEDVEFTKDSFAALYAKNNDLVGYLMFDSGIIEEPVVKSASTDYLTTAFDGSYSTQGTPFLDLDCNINSDNVTIYGHNVYYDDSAKFSQLQNMYVQAFFNENNTFTFYTAEEIRKYEVIAVYWYYRTDIGNFNFAKSSFSDKSQFDSYMNVVSSRNVISSGKTASYGDKLMTLQTCKKWDDDTHIIVLAKEISRKGYAY